MEKALVVLSRGTAFELSFEGEFNLNELNSKLNQRELSVLAIGDIVTHKSTIMYIKKSSETLGLTNANIDIQTHDDINIEAKDDNYSPSTLEIQINDYETSFVIIGDTIINKNSIKTISPIR